MSKKQGKEVHERILVLSDADKCAGHQIPGTFDYVLTEEESAKIPADSLAGKVVEMGVSEIVQWNGRPRLRGAISKTPDLPKPTKA